MCDLPSEIIFSFINEHDQSGEDQILVADDTTQDKQLTFNRLDNLNHKQIATTDGELELILTNLITAKKENNFLKQKLTALSNMVMNRKADKEFSSYLRNEYALMIQNTLTTSSKPFDYNDGVEIFYSISNETQNGNKFNNRKLNKRAIVNKKVSLNNKTKY